eukprot:maker-scaffold_1-snap-gene-25.12-mRNA-1 protein AED:0.00 eAED:0.00 QI:119/1/1/1/1/1/2/132/594
MVAQTKQNLDILTVENTSVEGVHTLKTFSVDLRNNFDLNEKGGLLTQKPCVQISVEFNGKHVAVLFDDEVKLLNIKSLSEVVGNYPLEVSFRALFFSRTGKFLVVGRELKSGTDENILIFSVDCGINLVKKLSDKFFDTNSFTSVSFSHDDETLFLRTSSGVSFFETKSFTSSGQVKAHGVAYISQPLKNPDNLFLTFFKEKSGKPGYGDIVKEGKSLARKNFFNAQSAVAKWSNTDFVAALLKTETAEDKSGQSYYGQSQLTLFYSTFDGFESTGVTGGSGEGVKDFAWCTMAALEKPVFVFLSGSQPAFASLHNFKGQAIFRFGEVYANHCIFNPFGRFLALAGFGNLPGDIEFWDLSPLVRSKKSGENPLPRKLGKNKAQTPVDFGWSADGRLFLTASTYPRRRVDNSLQIFSYYGEKLQEKPYDTRLKLATAEWRKTDTKLLRELGFDRGVDSRCPTSFKDFAASTTKGKTSGKYIPPGLRNKAKPSVPSGGLKKTLGASVIGSNASSLSVGVKSKKKKPKKKQIPEPPEAPVSKYSESEKLIRKLTKTLKSIELLEKKQAEGQVLNEAQLEKLKKKSEIEKELSSLQTA